MPLKGRNDKHLARRIWHVSGVLSVFIWYWLIPPKAAALFAVVVGATLISFDVGRLYVPALNRFFWWLFRPILRESERNRISGISWMVVGVGLIIFIYPKNVVLLALLFLAFADPMASEIGIRFGKDKLIGNKSLQGSLAAFAVCFVTSMIYFNALDLMRERLFIVSLLGGLIGAVSELLPLGKMDDNFVFPVLSATMLTGLFHIFGGF
jgi:diacylglycerol kinase (CTP)